MAKIVKYCSACDEGFAEKFVFCPNCGQGLTAFEMKPVVENLAVVPEVVAIAEAPKVVAFEEVIESKVLEVPTPIAIETPTETFSFTAPDLSLQENIEYKFIATEDSVEILPIEEKPVAIAAPVVIEQVTKDEFLEKETYGYIKTPAVSEYRPTFVEDRNGGIRSMLLTGALVLVTTIACGGWLYSLFARQLDVASLEEQVFVGNPITDIAPELAAEEEELKKKDKDDSGGGGGSGKNEKTPTSKGDLASQMEKPDFTPSASSVKLTNPDLKIDIATKGPAKREKTTNFGDPNSQFEKISDGTGNGGVMGSGDGEGQGGGKGPGRGPGSNGGRGGGSGGGVGPGPGSGATTREDDEPQRPTPTPAKPKKPAVTTALKIISQPRALYTDAARVAQTQGTVRLRVTFSANGSIASISPVSGLPNGLTEKAIEAARKISFTPKMEDGVAKSVTRVVDYSFTIH